MATYDAAPRKVSRLGQVIRIQPHRKRSENQLAPHASALLMFATSSDLGRVRQAHQGVSATFELKLHPQRAKPHGETALESSVRR